MANGGGYQTQSRFDNSGYWYNKAYAGAEVKVGSRVSGIVKSLRVKIGDDVQKGQLLVELDSIELQTRHKQLNAILISNQAAFDYANASLERQRALYEKN